MYVGDLGIVILEQLIKLLSHLRRLHRFRFHVLDFLSDVLAHLSLHVGHLVTQLSILFTLQFNVLFRNPQYTSH